MSPPRSPSGEDRAPAQRGLIVLIAGLLALRLASAALIPLTEDEAYYRLWAQHLHLGYYDHPPMIAWWIRAGMTVVGDDPLGVRLAPALASLISTLIVYDLGRRLGSAKTGLLAALLYNCTLTIGAAAALAVPDAPAGLFWTLALWALARTVDDGRPRWWLLAGTAAGLACLSKYSALFLAPSAVLWLALTPQGRRQFARPWPWVCALIAAALFSANIAWNAAHHWETFAKQFGRVSASHWSTRYLGEFVLGQFLLLNPAVAVLAGLGARKAWRARAETPIPALMLAAIIPFLAYLLVHSLHDRVQAHWPVPLYSSAAVLAAWAAGGARGWPAALARWAPLGLAVSVLALLHAALPATDFGKADPALQLRGWRPFAKAVDADRIAAGAAWTGTSSYGVNAQLQAARQSPAPILQIDERDRYAELPSSPAPDLSRPGLIVDLLRRINPAKLAACFRSVGPVAEIDRGPFRPAEGRYGAVRVAGPRVDLIGKGCGDQTAQH